MLVAGLDVTPFVWATLGASFSAICFGFYARFNQADDSSDADLVVIAFVATWLGFLTAMRPYWMW